MAQIILTVPDAQVPRILSAFRNQSGNPAYNQADLKAFLIAQVKGVVLAQEQKEAADLAAAAVNPVDVT